MEMVAFPPPGTSGAGRSSRIIVSLIRGSTDEPFTRTSLNV